MGKLGVVAAVFLVLMLLIAGCASGTDQAGVATSDPPPPAKFIASQNAGVTFTTDGKEMVNCAHVDKFGVSGCTMAKGASLDEIIRAELKQDQEILKLYDALEKEQEKAEGCAYAREHYRTTSIKMNGAL